MACVGIIANPASGRDVRRLVAGASVVDNAEKGAMIYRLMVGLGAVGTRRVLVMPAGSGVLQSLHRTLRGRARSASPLPDLELLDMRLAGTGDDTCRAVALIAGRRADAILVLGGDGTHRLVARHCGDVPICGLSTGTNNAFPTLHEATVAGLATGLVATGRVTRAPALRRHKILRVALNDDGERDCALVDAALTTERFVGARALWRPTALREVVVAFGEPGTGGLAALAGLLEPAGRTEEHGAYLRLEDPSRAPRVVRVPIAPGLVTSVGVAEHRRIEPAEPVALEPQAGSLALDGEREIELTPDDRVVVTLATDGPQTIDVGSVMREAAQRGLLTSDRSPARLGHRPTDAGIRSGR
ncbi:MAG: NAD(+)/NADH kinase [Gaiellales bacterium]